MKKKFNHSQETKEFLRQKALEQFKDGMPEATKKKLSKKLKMAWQTKDWTKRNQNLSIAKIKYYQEHPHPAKGTKRSEKFKQNLREIKTGDGNPNWKGNKVGYGALHEWVKKRLPKPKFCQQCHKNPPYDLANKGIYNRDFKNWEWLCRKCHMEKDGRMKKWLDYGHNYQKRHK